MTSLKLSQQTAAVQSAKVAASSSLSTESRNRASGFDHVLDDVAMANRQSSKPSQPIDPEAVPGDADDGGAQTSNTDIAASLEELLQQMTSQSNRKTASQDQNPETEDSSMAQLFVQSSQTPTALYAQSQIPGYAPSVPEGQKNTHQKSGSDETSYHSSLGETGSAATPGSNVPAYHIDGVRTFLAVAGSTTNGVASIPTPATTGLDPVEFTPSDISQLAQASSFRTSDILSRDQRGVSKASPGGSPDSSTPPDATESEQAEAPQTALKPIPKAKLVHVGSQGTPIRGANAAFSLSTSGQSGNSSADILGLHLAHVAEALSAAATGSESQASNNFDSSANGIPTASLTDLPAMIASFANQTSTENEQPSPSPQFASTVSGTPSAAGSVVKELDLSLHPEELGRVSVKLRSDSSGIAITIIAQRGEAARHLEGQKDEIVKSLTSAGQVVSSVVVREESGANSGNYTGQSSGGQQENAGGGAKQQSWNSNNGADGNTQSSQNGGDSQSGSNQQAVIDSDGGVPRSSLGLVV